MQKKKSVKKLMIPNIFKYTHLIIYFLYTVQTSYRVSSNEALRNKSALKKHTLRHLAK